MKTKLGTLILAMTTLTLAGAIGCNNDDSGAPAQNADNGSATDSSGRTMSKGVGPVSALKLEALNADLASKGHAVFQAKCTACHKIDEQYVGPALKGVTLRRQPEWIMNMILNPAEMTAKDPVAKELLAKHLTQMSFQNVNQDEVRSILEFFRQNDAGSGSQGMKEK